MVLPIILNIPIDNDRDFVENIYTKYEKKLFLTSINYLDNYHDSQDCVHETIKIVIEHIDKFRHAKEQGYLEKLLVVVCRNRAISMLRDRKHRNEHEQSITRYNYEEEEYEDIDIPDYDSCVEKIYISEENCRCIYFLMDKLDDKYRDVMILKCMDYEVKTIAEFMSITEELVRQRYSRAKKKLLKMGGKNLYVR